MTARFYGNAESAANDILRVFQNPEQLPEALAPIFIRRNDDTPCRQWSWGNQLIAALHGHFDARGFRQWQEVGRHVRKGEKSFAILVPITKTFEREKADTGETETATALVGFKSAAVFGYSQTDGEPLANGDPECAEWLRSLPLREVADAWAIRVDTFDGEAAPMKGQYHFDGSIGLGVKNLSTWCHEMIHAADHRNVGTLKGGQQVDQEIVAELGGAVLLTVLGYRVEADLGGCWDYVKTYAEQQKVDPVAACQKLLTRTCEAVSLILNTAESLKPAEPAAVC